MTCKKEVLSIVYMVNKSILISETSGLTFLDVTGCLAVVSSAYIWIMALIDTN